MQAWSQQHRSTACNEGSSRTRYDLSPAATSHLFLSDARVRPLRVGFVRRFEVTLDRELLATRLNGRLSRRRLLWMSASAAATLPLMPLLAACGGDDDDDDGGESTTTAATATAGGAPGGSTPSDEPTSAATEEEEAATEEGAATEAGGAATEAPAEATTGGGSTGEGVPGGTLTMSYGNVVADTLNQHLSNHTQSRMQARHVLDCLTYVEPETGEVTPWLADAWEVSEDATEYTFTLRDGVMFHDGNPFNADAVKANFDYTMNPDIAHGFAYGALGGEKYDNTEVVDDMTVKVTYKEPHGTLLVFLSDGGLGIDSPAALEEMGDDYGIKGLVGTGPFKFVDFVLKDHFTVEKNPDYNWGPAAAKHQGPAYLDKIIFQEIAENATRGAAVQNGDVDMAQLVANQASEFEGSDDAEVIIVPKAGTTRMFLMNTVKAPTDDINVRTALAHAWDAEAFINLPVMSGVGKPALGPLPSNMVPGGDLSMLEGLAPAYDPDLANQMLEEAGWTMGSDDIREKDGQQLILDMVCLDTDIPQVEPFDGLLNEVGAKLNIRSGDFNFWLDTLDKGDFQVTLMSDSGYNAPGLIEEFFFSTAVYNDYGINDPDIDAAITAAIAASDADTRWENLMTAIQAIVELVPGVWAWEDQYVFAARSRVKDPVFNEVGFAYFYDTWVEG
jgi:peptide/nickel transport system substrate-binding protein